MRDHDDVFRGIDAGLRCDPQIRIYIAAGEWPPLTAIAACTPDYELVVPHRAASEPPFELVLIRKLECRSGDAFRTECTRVATLLAPVLDAETVIEVLYDEWTSPPEAAGRTRHRASLRKDAATGAFVEAEPGPEITL